MYFDKGHNFHIVPSSPWPLYIAAVVLMMLLELCKIMHLGNELYYLVNFGYCVFFLGFLIFSWLEDISIESVQIQTHSDAVRTGLRIGMVLFIITEVMFFFSFFWAYFHAALSPSIYIGCQWPSKGLASFYAFGVPLLNTVLLVTSGAFLTYSHHLLVNNEVKESQIWTGVAILFGVVFMGCQLYEYHTLPFNINDSVYGSTFFLLTGFHGFHVIVGLVMLSTVYVKLGQNFFNGQQHVGFECAAWYWHFVDVVWLFLFIWVYCWGAPSDVCPAFSNN